EFRRPFLHTLHKVLRLTRILQTITFGFYIISVRCSCSKKTRSIAKEKLPMKKSVSLLLAGLMLCGALAGCGGNNNTAENTDSQTEQTSESTGMSGAIHVVSREDGSGTRGAFVELTGVEDDNGDNTTVDAEIANRTDAVLTT